MNIFLSGITGNMGETIIENCGNNKIVGGYASNDGVIDGIPYTNKLDSIELDFDIIIDFSTKDCLQDILNFALDIRKLNTISSFFYITLTDLMKTSEISFFYFIFVKTPFEEPNTKCVSPFLFFSVLDIY